MKLVRVLSELERKVLVVANEEDLERELSRMSSAPAPVRVAFVNAHAVNMCMHSEEFLSHLIECDYVFRDGVGMRMFYRMCGRDSGLNLNGTDLIPRMLRRFSGRDVALYGTRQDVLARAAAVAAELGLKPSTALDGFRPDEAYVEAASAREDRVVVLGMGMPKQERIASALARALSHSCVIICGGAVLDFWGGKVTRAPLVVRRLGAEWLYRLMQEPGRLFSRYVVGNVAFLARCSLYALLLRSSFRAKKTATGQAA